MGSPIHVVPRAPRPAVKALAEGLAAGDRDDAVVDALPQGITLEQVREVIDAR